VNKYFYIVSITWSRNGTPHHGVLTGVADVGDNETQETVFSYLIADACERYGVPAGAYVLNYYSLVRNEL